MKQPKRPKRNHRNNRNERNDQNETTETSGTTETTKTKPPKRAEPPKRPAKLRKMEASVLIYDVLKASVTKICSFNIPLPPGISWSFDAFAVQVLIFLVCHSCHEHIKLFCFKRVQHVNRQHVMFITFIAGATRDSLVLEDQ